MEGIGVFSSCVTAFRKLSCRSLRRISRTMKIVLTTKPAIITPKKIMPNTSGTTCRRWNTTQVMWRKTATPTRQAPSVMKKAMAFVRLVMRIAASLIHRRDCRTRWRGLDSVAGSGNQGFFLDKWLGRNGGWLDGFRGLGVRLQLRHLDVPRQAEFLQHRDSVPVHVNFVPG